MKIIERTVLHEGLGYHGMSIVLAELKNGYGVYYYIHCEDRYSEAMTTTDETEAREYYRRDSEIGKIKAAILNVARKRVAAGATREDIRKYQDYLGSIWGLHPDIKRHVDHLEWMVFEG